MGLSLWVFGAALWAYTVLGELVVSVEIPEILAWIALAVAVGQNWRTSVRHIPTTEVRRRVEPLGAGILLGLLVLLLCAALLGSYDRSEIEAVTIVLWVLSVAAYAVGRYWAATPKVRASGWARAGGISAWTVTVIATLVAHLSILHNL